MVIDFYKYLSQEKKVPTTFNPMGNPDATKADKMRFELIQKMNKTEPSEDKKRFFSK